MVYGSAGRCGCPNLDLRRGERYNLVKVLVQTPLRVVLPEDAGLWPALVLDRAVPKDRLYQPTGNLIKHF